MRVLVTGADGFIGGRLVAGLSARGHEVTGAVFARAAGDGEVRVDLTCEAELSALPTQVDAVVNASGVIDPKAGAAAMFAVNTRAVAHLARWARAHDVTHFVQLSSIAVYGPLTVGEGRTETTWRLGRFVGLPYMRSKARAEVAIEHSGVPYTFLRPPGVIGPGDTAVSGGFARALVEGPGLPLVRGARPDRRVSLCFVDGLVALVARALEHGPLGGPVHAIDAELTLDELAALYARALRAELRYVATSWAEVLRRMDDPGFAWLVASARFGQHYSGEYLRKTLAYEPPLTLDAAIRGAVSGLQGNKPGLS